MKKVVMIICTIAFLFFSKNVYAKDTFKSINKYEEESLNYIYKSYNKKNNVDGLITAGIYAEIEDKDKEEKNTQIIVVKYDDSAKEIWTYSYGKSADDKLFYLTYSYDENDKINGYILVVNETKDRSDLKEVSPLFIKLDLDGKVVEEKSMSLPSNTEVKKVIETYNDEKKINGYLIVGSMPGENNRNAVAVKYNLSLDKEWQKEYPQEGFATEITDIISVNKTTSYRMIMSYDSSNEKKHSLLLMDSEGNVTSTIKEDFESEDNPKLLDTKDSYLVYGYNHNVKLKNDKTTSYYIIKYNIDNAEEWETIGNIPINDKKLLEMQTFSDQEQAYLIMYINDNDDSIEVTKLNESGEIENKIKKINNDYYSINKFLYSNDTLFFVGQITCPDDDNCDYNMKSLLLISTEDKVIEVEEEDNTAIFVVMISIVLFTILLYILRKIQKKKEAS